MDRHPFSGYREDHKERCPWLSGGQAHALGCARWADASIIAGVRNQTVAAVRVALDPDKAVGENSTFKVAANFRSTLKGSASHSSRSPIQVARCHWTSQ